MKFLQPVLIGLFICWTYFGHKKLSVIILMNFQRPSVFMKKILKGVRLVGTRLI